MNKKQNQKLKSPSEVEFKEQLITFGPAILLMVPTFKIQNIYEAKQFT